MPRTVAATGGPACWCNSTDCSGFPTSVGASTASTAIAAGCDLDCGSVYKNSMKEALESGAVQEAQLDEALTRLFLNRMKTGEFDPPEQNPYRQIPPSAANSPKHQALAQNAAAEGLTLLKNDRVLPLSQKTIRSLSVIGPNANCTQQVRPHGPQGDHHCNQLGNYATESPFVITPADALSKFATVTGCQGSNISIDHSGPLTAADMREFELASSLAKDADATVLVVGMLVLREATDPKFGTSCCEGEGNDRDGCVLKIGMHVSGVYRSV